MKYQDTQDQSTATHVVLPASVFRSMQVYASKLPWDVASPLMDDFRQFGKPVVEMPEVASSAAKAEATDKPALTKKKAG